MDVWTPFWSRKWTSGPPGRPQGSPRTPQGSPGGSQEASGGIRPRPGAPFWDPFWVNFWCFFWFFRFQNSFKIFLILYQILDPKWCHFGSILAPFGTKNRSKFALNFEGVSVTDFGCSRAPPRGENRWFSLRGRLKIVVRPFRARGPLRSILDAKMEPKREPKATQTS